MWKICFYRIFPYFSCFALCASATRRCAELIGARGFPSLVGYSTNHKVLLELHPLWSASLILPFFSDGRGCSAPWESFLGIAICHLLGLSIIYSAFFAPHFLEESVLTKAAKRGTWQKITHVKAQILPWAEVARLPFSASELKAPLKKDSCGKLPRPLWPFPRPPTPNQLSSTSGSSGSGPCSLAATITIECSTVWSGGEGQGIQDEDGTHYETLWKMY